MKVLVLGSGAREHAISWKLSKSRLISGLYVAPGNVGTADIAENLPDVSPLDFDKVVAVCRERKVDLVVVGPEDPLAAGVVDRLTAEGIAAFGPHKAAAKLESNKAFAKRFMIKYGVPTAEAEEFESVAEFDEYMKVHKNRVVVKKSGLAGGKGVLDVEDREEQLKFGHTVLKDDRLVVEEFLTGIEISVFALSDGKTHTVLPFCADFKKSKEEDAGKNTGGMGAVCPVPMPDPVIVQRVIDEIVEPTFTGLAEEGLDYRGVLYFGIIVTASGPKLLEYNVRFGDPETQVLLPVLDSDLGDLIDALIKGKLADFPVRISNASSLGVVVASKGYPNGYRTGVPVGSLPAYPESEVLIFHAATKHAAGNQTVTGGGRCFTVVGIGDNLLTANVRAYDAVAKVQFDGAWYRKDIGKKFFID